MQTDVRVWLCELKDGEAVPHGVHCSGLGVWRHLLASSVMDQGVCDKLNTCVRLRKNEIAMSRVRTTGLQRTSQSVRQAPL